MASFKEIVTKTVIGKGKKQFSDNLSLQVTNRPTTILGCWVINHSFSGELSNNTVIIKGSYDINIWYSYDNDTKTEVFKETKNYTENVNVQFNNNDISNLEVIVRSLSIELVGDAKVRISALDEVDDWDDILESDDKIDEVIDKEVNENYLTDE